MTTDSSFSKPNSNNRKVLILLLVLASGRGMPLGKNGASFQRKAEQWSRQDNDLSAKQEAPFASMTFEHFFAENEVPLTFNHFSDKYEALLVFKSPLAENEASLARLFDENEAPLARLFDENEDPLARGSLRRKRGSTRPSL